MEFSNNEKVNAFLEDLQFTSAGKLELVMPIREIFISADSSLSEDIKYGGIVYSQAGALIGGIFPYSEHVSVEFSNGFKLHDPEGKLEGKGKKRRHLKIYDIKDIESKSVRFFVTETVRKQSTI